MSTETYDPGQHYITIGGVPITGFAEGTYLKAERVSDAFDDIAGASGEVGRVRIRDKRGNIELTLLATSFDNDYLSGLAARDEKDASGVVTFSMRDGNGTTVITAANCWIKKKSSVENGKEMPNRTWMLRCANLDITIGGNF